MLWIEFVMFRGVLFWTEREFITYNSYLAGGYVYAH